MTYNPDLRHRRTIRLQGYDYSLAGMYFITLCTKDHKCLFGDIADGKMRLSEAGGVVEKCWNDIPSHFPHVALDGFVIMPNHIHGIVAVGAHGIVAVGANNHSPKTASKPGADAVKTPATGTAKTIGSIVRGFKIGVTKWMRANTSVRDAWQRNYWERVIRDEAELTSIREYIQNNPAQWALDKLYQPSNGRAS